VKNFIQDANPDQRRRRRQSHLGVLYAAMTWAKL
jgi:hypothetical protein